MKFEKHIVDEAKLLDEYIDERFSDCKPWLTAEQRKAISDTAGFQYYLLQAAWDRLKRELRKTFPFSLFANKDGEAGD